MTSTDATPSPDVAVSDPAPAKEHFAILDGLRGVAAVMVVAFHVFETWALGDPFKQIINHGYLAVDFFFLLSGFVIAYAYDDRWGSMTRWEFFKRRLVRLQPMIIMGSLIGAALFAFQISSVFPKAEGASIIHVLAVMLIGFTMIPLPKSADVRGWDEIYPLNGPAWSLFYEYIANILYALALRKLSNRILWILVILAAGLTLHLALFGARGDFIGGWALDWKGVHIGLTRVLFPFLMGVLLFRLGWRVRVKHAFAVAALILAAALCLPRFGTPEQTWINGLYEACVILFVFPLVVAIGAGDKRADGPDVRLARVFGDLSYPIYITHYPLIYIYTGWVVDHRPGPLLGGLVGFGVFIAAIALAWTCLKLYDEPVRRWLTKRVLKRSATA